MGYTALYRKFRPLTFSEIVGQEHITKTLKNQIIAGRVGHAYLLNGGRGTGKTSAAKVLARAVNCLNPQDRRTLQWMWNMQRSIKWLSYRHCRNGCGI